jgi:hypothetical protein
MREAYPRVFLSTKVWLEKVVDQRPNEGARPVKDVVERSLRRHF